jgi:hypothetical protein
LIAARAFETAILSFEPTLMIASKATNRWRDGFDALCEICQMDVVELLAPQAVDASATLGRDSSPFRPLPRPLCFKNPSALVTANCLAKRVFVWP